MSHKNGENLIQRVLTNPDKFKRNMEENVEQQMEGMQQLEDDILENPEDLIVYNPRCIRNRSNWTTASNAYKFDRPSSFQPNKLLQAMPLKSPKMEKLLSHIKELDEADKKRDGTYYKHFIFSDIKNGMYGAKLLASAFIASGYNLGYGRGRKKLELKSDETLAKTPYNNFYLLSSGAVYDSPISVAAKRTMLKKYNSRPDNSYGKEVRFIIMDSGFKEGIDLFDVKYVHIFEPQTTMADQKQVIGRATRTCGQKGLEFHPTQGWPLHVFNYDLHISPKYAPIFYDSSSAIELYLKTAGIDFRKLNFVSDLERASILASVDYELNRKIHNFSIVNDDNDKFASASASQRGGNETTPKLKLKRCSRGFRRNKRTGECKRKRCPNGTHRNPKTQKCETFIPKLRTRKRDKSKSQMKSQQTPNLDNFASLSQNLSSLSSSFPPPPPHPETMTKIKPSLSLSSDVSSLSNVRVPYYERFAPETPTMNFYELNEYVNDNFNDYAWDEIKMENLCVKKTSTATVTNEKKKGGAKQKTDLITFTPTQDFVRHYFTPNNPVRGMLLWHSVGTGKTCSAIATATSAFEPRGYTILWVTRTTLKNDIWKNMFEQVCHEQFRRDKVRQISDEHTERMRLLSKSWSIRPMSYKQFSNLVSQKNEIYKDLVKKNGAVDPLNKTLLIIDEAHKLYGGSDLSAIERPDMNALHKALMKSYMVSGANSVKLLLMTATPITSDPMELIKLLNLCKLPNQQMPTSFDAFADEYLNAEKGVFTAKGEEKYLNDIAGHISYLNREKDARQFAQPRLKNVVVPLVSPKVEQLINKVDKKYAKENINRDTLDLLIEQKNYEKQLEGDLEDLNAAKFAFLNKMACPDTFKMDATDKRKCNAIVKKHVKVIVEELKAQKAQIKDKLSHLKEKIKAIHAKYPAAAAKTANINKQDMEKYKDTTFYNFKYVCGEKVNTGPALVANLKNHPMMLEIDDSIAEMQSEVERMKEYVSLKKGAYEDRVKQLKEMIEKLEQRGIISKEERNGLLNEVENTQNQNQNKKEKEKEKEKERENKEVKILRNAEKIIMKTRKQLITAKNKTMKNIESKYKKILKENEKRKKREKKELLKEKREATDDRYIQGQTLKEKIRKSYEEIQNKVSVMLEETKQRREEKERRNRAKTMKQVNKELVQTQKRKERVRKKADQDYKRQLRTYKRVLAETIKAQKKRTKRLTQK